MHADEQSARLEVAVHADNIRLATCCMGITMPERFESDFAMTTFRHIGELDMYVSPSAALSQPNDRGGMNAFVSTSALCHAPLNGPTSSPTGEMTVARTDERFDGKGLERSAHLRFLRRFSDIYLGVFVALTSLLNAGNAQLSAATKPCRIEVLEKDSGWPVPMVELRTLHNVRFVSDNAGLIAFDLPELMEREVWFEVVGHGYEVPKDGFGYRGVRLRPEPGKTLRVAVERRIVAKRLGRLTGAGRFGESEKLGEPGPEDNLGILGCDSVQNAVYKGLLYWAWGDTTLSHYPLGIFHMTSATTPVKPLASFEPPVKLKFDYFTDPKGAPRAVAPMPGSGPTWVTGYTSLPDKTGAERLVGSYAKIKPPLEAYQWGLCVWDDQKLEFVPHKIIWTKSESAPERPPVPDGHPIFFRDSAEKQWVLFGNPLPTLRCPATFEAWENPATWESLEPQPTLVSATDGKPVKPHSGSVAWNSWRKRWVTVFTEAFGKPSAFGEVWYAEADAPTGPWGKAVKIISHENYTFYNPRIHPEMTPRDSPILLFEGTHSKEFADRPPPTPRYDYNQILYRLDLDDPALKGAQH